MYAGDVIRLNNGKWRVCLLGWTAKEVMQRCLGGGVYNWGSGSNVRNDGEHADTILYNPNLIDTEEEAEKYVEIISPLDSQDILDESDDDLRKLFDSIRLGNGNRNNPDLDELATVAKPIHDAALDVDHPNREFLEAFLNLIVSKSKTAGCLAEAKELLIEIKKQDPNIGQDSEKLLKLYESYDKQEDLRAMQNKLGEMRKKWSLEKLLGSYQGSSSTMKIDERVEQLINQKPKDLETIAKPIFDVYSNSEDFTETPLKKFLDLMKTSSNGKEFLGEAEKLLPAIKNQNEKVGQDCEELLKLYKSFELNELPGMQTQLAKMFQKWSSEAQSYKTKLEYASLREQTEIVYNLYHASDPIVQVVLHDFLSFILTGPIDREFSQKGNEELKKVAEKNEEYAKYCLSLKELIANSNNPEAMQAVAKQIIKGLEKTSTSSGPRS